MAGPMQLAGQKRKSLGGKATEPGARKRLKNMDARNILTQTADAALSTGGELNIASFIKSREYEINSLDKSMRKARQGLMSRAFQQVPRHLRRRTASHNVKKVPRRLRGRAAREMKEDNTPAVVPRNRTPSAKLRLRLENVKTLKKLTAAKNNVRQKEKKRYTSTKDTSIVQRDPPARVPKIKKNKLSDAPRATTKFKRRQVKKTWLPTHMWHTKRAHMTRPIKPLWRMAIPLSPTEKCYRPSYRAANSRGCIAWDTSYMSTIGCQGTEAALEGILKALHFAGEGWIGTRFKKWKAGTRTASSWVAEKSNSIHLIAPITVIWCSPSAKVKDKHDDKVDSNLEYQTVVEVRSQKQKKVKLDRRLIIRVHPSSFHQLWQELICITKMQKPQVLMEDLRFEIGSIEVMGPGSTEALRGVLHPADLEEITAQHWTRLTALSNPAQLPVNALLAFDVIDPRLNHPPKQLKIEQDESNLLRLTQVITDWPLDEQESSSGLFSHKARYLARRLPSQKALNRRKSLNVPGKSLISTAKDPAIPVMLFARRPMHIGSNMQGSWVLLAPWSCIDPIWRSLMYYPLTSGSTPRFGGLDEVRHIAFEQSLPWYPGDFPGTKAGKVWEQTQAENQFDDWVRKPPSRRLAFESVDLGLERRGEVGRGWTCDWEYLFKDASEPIQLSIGPSATVTQAQRPDPPLLTQRQRKQARAKLEAIKVQQSRRQNTSSPDPDDDSEELESPLVASPEFSQISPSIINSLLTKPSMISLPSKPVLITVKVTLLSRGTPLIAARIYRLPKAIPIERTAELEHNSNVSKSIPPLSENTPPAAQPSPALLSSSHGSSISKDIDLRTKWLKLDPGSPSSTFTSHTGKSKSNRHSQPRKHSHLPLPSLKHINVLPKDATQEIIDAYGPKAPTSQEKQAEIDELQRIKLEEDQVWDVHIPCPDVEDLIGFVTTGGYNIAEGKGTAIGGLWTQRLVEGWIREDNEDKESNDVSPRVNKIPENVKQKKRMEQKKTRERRLCIVRNAGESIGRLGIWEVCDI